MLWLYCGKIGSVHRRRTVREGYCSEPDEMIVA